MSDDDNDNVIALDDHRAPVTTGIDTLLDDAVRAALLENPAVARGARLGQALEDLLFDWADENDVSTHELCVIVSAVCANMIARELRGAECEHNDG